MESTGIIIGFSVLFQHYVCLILTFLKVNNNIRLTKIHLNYFLYTYLYFVQFFRLYFWFSQLNILLGNDCKSVSHG